MSLVDKGVLGFQGRAETGETVIVLVLARYVQVTIPLGLRIGGRVGLLVRSSLKQR